MDIKLIEPSGLEVLLIDPDAAAAGMLSKIISSSGYRVVGIVSEPGELLEAIERHKPSVMLLNPGAFEAQFLTALNALPENLRRPTLMLSGSDAPRDMQGAVSAGVNAYLVVGINGNRLRDGIDLAVANFTNVAFLKNELNEARSALEDRKVIERAKGLIMKHRGLGEAEAYKLMRNRAMERGVRLIDIANGINEAATLIE